MKKIIILIAVITMIHLSCSKDNKIGAIPDQTNSQILVAEAGSDIIVYKPYDGEGYIFKAQLDAKASYDKAGTINFCNWTEINVSPQVGFSYTMIETPNALTTSVTMQGGVHKFRVEIRDNQKLVAYDTVTVTADQLFGYRYDGLTWDSATTGLSHTDIVWKPGLIGAFPGLTPSYTWDPNFVNICFFNGDCNDINNWKAIPFVTYDSIGLTDRNFFYSSNDANYLDGMGYFVIYARKNTGIDLTQPVSIGLGRIK